MNTVFPAAPQATVAVQGEEARFPVRRIFCVGRNYAAHAREMGKDPDREPPFFFTKPADAVCDTGATVPYPPETENFHHEIELVVPSMSVSTTRIIPPLLPVPRIGATCWRCLHR